MSRLDFARATIADPNMAGTVRSTSTVFLQWLCEFTLDSERRANSKIARTGTTLAGISFKDTVSRFFLTNKAELMLGC